MSRAMHDTRVRKREEGGREGMLPNVTGIAQRERPLPKRFHARKLIFCFQFVTIIARHDSSLSAIAFSRLKRDRDPRLHPVASREFARKHPFALK